MMSAALGVDLIAAWAGMRGLGGGNLELPCADHLASYSFHVFLCSNFLINLITLCIIHAPPTFSFSSLYVWGFKGYFFYECTGASS